MSKLIILCLGAVFVIALSSCSTPGSGPTPGESAVLAHSLSFSARPDSLVERKRALAEMQGGIVR